MEVDGMLLITIVVKQTGDDQFEYAVDYGGAKPLVSADGTAEDTRDAIKHDLDYVFEEKFGVAQGDET